MGDGLEPGADGAPSLIKGMGLLPRSEEDLLQVLLRFVAVAKDSHKQREDNMSVALVQRLERGRFTGNNRGDQRVIRDIIWQQANRLNWIPAVVRSDDAQALEVARSLWRWLQRCLQLVQAVPARAASSHACLTHRRSTA